MSASLTVGGAIFLTIWLLLASLFIALLLVTLVFVGNILTVMCGIFKMLWELKW